MDLNLDIKHLAQLATEILHISGIVRVIRVFIQTVTVNQIKPLADGC